MAGVKECYEQWSAQYSGQCSVDNPLDTTKTLPPSFYQWIIDHCLPVKINLFFQALEPNKEALSGLLLKTKNKKEAEYIWGIIKEVDSISQSKVVDSVVEKAFKNNQAHTLSYIAAGLGADKLFIEKALEFNTEEPIALLRQIAINTNDPKKLFQTTARSIAVCKTPSRTLEKLASFFKNIDSYQTFEELELGRLFVELGYEQYAKKRICINVFQNNPPSDRYIDHLLTTKAGKKILRLNLKQFDEVKLGHFNVFGTLLKHGQCGLLRTYIKHNELPKYGNTYTNSRFGFWKHAVSGAGGVLDVLAKHIEPDWDELIKNGTSLAVFIELVDAYEPDWILGNQKNVSLCVSTLMRPDRPREYRVLKVLDALGFDLSRYQTNLVQFVDNHLVQQYLRRRFGNENWALQKI